VVIGVCRRERYSSLTKQVKEVLTINVHVVYMGRDVLIWMRGIPLRGPEGVGPESRDFFGLLNGSECHLGPKKSCTLVNLWTRDEGREEGAVHYEFLQNNFEIDSDL
jgi:hypothetical protein